MREAKADIQRLESGDLVDLTGNKPQFLEELEYLEEYSNQVTGLSLLVDVGDSSDLSELYGFSNLSSLRLKFVSPLGFENVDSSLFSVLPNLIGKVDTVWLEGSLPEDVNAVISTFANYLSQFTPHTSTLMISSGWFHKRKGDDMLTSTLVTKSLERYHYLKVMTYRASPRGGSVKLLQVLKDRETCANQYEGMLSLDGDFSCKAESAYIDHEKFFVFRFSGADLNDLYTAEIRCKWNPLENGFYFGNAGKISYKDYPNQVEPFSLKVIDVGFQGAECSIKAIWKQNDAEYSLRGTLSAKNNKFS